MEALHRPTVLHEVRGEVVEQLRVRGLLGHVAEVVGRVHEAFAEVLGPGAVHGHAGGDGIVLGDDGLGELVATAAVDIRATFADREDVEELAGHDLTLEVLVATLEHVAVLRAFGVLDDHRVAGDAGVGETELVDLRVTEVGDGLAVADAAVDRAVLPVLTELTRAEEGDHLFVVEELVVGRDGPRIARHLGDGRRGLLPLFARLGQEAEVGEDRGLVLDVDALVGGGDVMHRLRFDVPQAGGDDRVHAVLRIVEVFLEDDRGALGEVDERHGSQGGEGTGDRRILLDAHGGEVRVGLQVDLVAVGVFAGLGGAAADGGDHEATGHLVVVAGAGLAHVAEEAGDLLVLELVEALKEVGTGGGGVTGGRDRGLVQGLDDRGEDAVQGVVVLDRDRVELVIVATRAGDGQAEEGLGRRVDALIDGVMDVVEALADGDEAEGGETRIVRRDVRDAVRGELLDDELVVRLVLVHRVDHVVAIGPGVGVAVVAEEAVALVDLEAARVGVAGGVEPVTGPAFAVVRRGEEEVDLLDVDGFEVAGRATGAGGERVGEAGVIAGLDECVDLFGGGREADQIVVDATQEGFGTRGRIGLEALLFELGEDERVDGILDPGLVLHFGHRVLLDGLVRPMFAGLAGEAGQLGGPATRHRRTHLDPLFKEGDFFVGQFAAGLLGRHRELGIGVLDGLDEQGLLEVAGDDGGTFVAALVGAVAGVEDEAALRGILLGGVALIATVDEDRADVLLEELEAFLGRLRFVGGDREGGSEQREGEGGVTERQHVRVF